MTSLSYPLNSLKKKFFYSNKIYIISFERATHPLKYFTSYIYIQSIKRYAIKFKKLAFTNKTRLFFFFFFTSILPFAFIFSFLFTRFDFNKYVLENVRKREEKKNNNKKIGSQELVTNIQKVEEHVSLTMEKYEF